ncbi:HK97 family phage prohead protease [Pseudonocardia benzenivorans]|uniref:HK97 family phage prohead protease n=1 Tax=Pseudonocardia benzenivorans TaxID=228005 RepID=A0ABW3VTE5_9PSEU
MSELERRYQPGTVEVRAAADGGTKLGGYALKWNTLSRNLGGFVETIAPGACSKSVSDGLDVLCRFQHRDEFLLGRVAAGTLRLTVDNTGLDYDCDLPDTSTGRDCGALAGRGDLRYSSFAFYTLDDEWEMTENGFPLRRLLQIQLVDVAPVVDPAYLDTSTGLRSLAEQRGADLAEVEALAKSNRLAELVGRSVKPTVVDLGAGNEPPEGRTDSENGGQVDNHPSLSLRRRRVELYGRRNFAGQRETHPASGTTTSPAGRDAQEVSA